MAQQEIAAIDSDPANQFAQSSQKAFSRNFGQNLSPKLFRINARSRLLDARFAVAGIGDPGLTRPSRSFPTGINSVGYRFSAAQFAQFFDHFIERDLSQALDGFDDRHFEMELLVRSPFHAPFC